MLHYLYTKICHGLLGQPEDRKDTTTRIILLTILFFPFVLLSMLLSIRAFLDLRYLASTLSFLSAVILLVIFIALCRIALAKELGDEQ